MDVRVTEVTVVCVHCRRAFKKMPISVHDTGEPLRVFGICDKCGAGPNSARERASDSGAVDARASRTGD
jgi:hypothetical protein